ncbi:Gfo/Idh/MocA family oxidoreductase [soil metagenome]
MHRRRFLATAAAGSTSALAFPHLTRAAADPTKLNMAVIGAGGMGGYAVGEAAAENLVAFCDVDDRRAEGAYKDHPDVPRFSDFRVMLEKLGGDIEAVCISTPDHTHFPAALACMEAGKHVFVQKPLTHNLWQGRTLLKAARHYGVKTQMGNQGHTFEGIRLIKEWFEAGLLGEVREIHAWTDRPHGGWYPKSDPPLPAETVPDPLDWDSWLGPVTGIDGYNGAYLPGKWRGWWPFGAGGLGDIGCHTLDSPFYAMDLGMPESVETTSEDRRPQLYPRASVITYRFPALGGRPPVTMTWSEDGKKPEPPEGFDAISPPSADGQQKSGLHDEGGLLMVGSERTLYHAGMRPNSPQLVMPHEEWRDFRRQGGLPDESIPRVKDGPIREWIRWIKGEGPEAGSNFEYACPLNELVMVGCLALRSDTNFEWDSENLAANGHPELDSYIKEPVRDGWSFGENLWT